MPGISTGITFDANLMNLKLIDNSQVRSEVVDFYRLMSNYPVIYDSKGSSDFHQQTNFRC